MAHAYGSRLAELLGDAAGAADLGNDLAGGLTERELAWMHAREWARTADDVLTRRSKLGLTLDAAGREAVERWWTARFGLPAAA